MARPDFYVLKPTDGGRWYLVIGYIGKREIYNAAFELREAALSDYERLQSMVRAGRGRRTVYSKKNCRANSTVHSASKRKDNLVSVRQRRQPIRSGAFREWF